MLSKIAGAIERLPFRQKLRLAPTVAAVALGLIFVTTLVLGLIVQRQQSRIQRGYYPAVQLSGQLAEKLEATQRALQDAASAADPERLLVADSIKSSFAKALEGARDNAVLDQRDLDSLGSAYLSYYHLARSTTESMMSGRNGGEAIAGLRQMVASHRTIRSALERNRLDNIGQIDRAFRSLRLLQAAVGVATLLLTIGCVTVLIWLSRLTGRALAAPVRDAVRVADALAMGDVSVGIEVHSDDELGQLLSSMQQMVLYLREMADVAERIGRGDLNVTITPRSAQDAFGKALVNMTTYLGDMARVADEISSGRLDARVEPRGELDQFGHAFVRMTRSLSELIGDIGASADAIAVAATELTESAQGLSEGATEEAASVMQT
ncbi:MAG: mcp40H-21, partial [Gemmatimonadetes bacterium]|nr:mcp40H-21 [Gemmatimonadota bacterium]